MEMHQIRYFLAVCETLNFTRGAESCNVTQPALTRAVQKLEEEMGGLLLHRERSRTHLAEYAALLRIVVTPAATTSMALMCRWRSRPQHQKRSSACRGSSP